MAAEPSRGRATEVERSSAPEADAARALYERHARQLYSFCLHKLGSREEAEDAVQTTFLNAFRGLRRGVVPEAEAAWLFKIAENVCLTRRRSAWRRGRVESPSDMHVLQEVTPARQSDGGDELIPLSEALAAMPDTQRRAILLREWQGLSYKEISAEMDVSQSAVETLIFRARRSLASALETPWESRRSAGQAGQRAFNLGSLLAGLKGLFAGGTAAKVAVVAVAAGGTAALAVADTHVEGVPPRVEPSAASARAPDSATRRPVVVAGADSGFVGSTDQPVGSKPEPKRGQAKTKKGSRALAVSTGEGEQGAQTESGAREMPPGQAKEPGTPATPRGKATRGSHAEKTKATPKQKSKSKSRAVLKTKKKPKSARPKPKPSPPPAATSPTQSSDAPGAPPPASPPPPPPSPPAEKGKDKPKEG